MNPLVGALNGLAARWAEIAWAVSWQAVILLAAIAIAARFMRGSSPGLRYWLWQVAAAKLLLMPLWGVYVPMPWQVGHGPGGHRQSLSSSEGSEVSAHLPEARLPGLGDSIVGDGQPIGPRGRRPEPIGWRTWLFMGWGLAVILQLASILNQRRRLMLALERTRPAEDPALRSLVGELSRQIGLSRPPRILLGDDIGSPFVCNPLRPALVLPRELISSLTPESKTPVLLHELSHIRRRDLIWGWLPTIARLLYVFHPAAHYIEFRTRLERELACDQAAMVLTGRAAAGYASTLVEVMAGVSASTALRSRTTPSRPGIAEP